MSTPLEILLRLLIGLVGVGLWLLILGGGVLLLHFLLSLPLRRAERARLILDLIETALQRGEPVEQSLIAISLSRDPHLGIHFHLLVAWLEKGLSLPDALRKVPNLLPRQVTAMLQAGARIGDLRKVLPACRQLLADSVSETRSALNYLVVITFIVSPATIAVFLMSAVVVFPKFHEIGVGLGGVSAAGIDWLLQYRFWFVFGQIAIQIGVFLGVAMYLLGPRSAWLPGMDRLHWWLPWRRKRLQRDFSGMLAVLLDAEMPEPEALALAANCTSNGLICKRAAAARSRMQEGESLFQAIQVIDPGREFQWRLTNAVHGNGDFRSALAGWHEALSAKAFQLQQSVAHIASTSLVLLNGVFVAIVVIAVFSFLISVINCGILW